MKNRNTRVRLTNAELQMMQWLWEAGKPLNRAELLEIIERDSLVSKNSFHVIINNLIEYQYIAPFISNASGRKNSRRFAPLITRNEYFALQITGTEHYDVSDIPDIVAALFKYSKVENKEEILEQIGTAVRSNTK